MSIIIFTITHKSFTPPPDPLYIPLHVGREGKEDLGYLGDNTGNNISHKNTNYCELTGMYWLWKNYHQTDYIGICHYRRYLINENGVLFTEQELASLLTQYDMITTKLLTLPGSYYDGFSANHHVKDLLTTKDVIQEMYPEYLDTFNRLICGPHTYFGNIMITSKTEYDRYCQWLFAILFEVEKRCDFTGYNGYQMRLFGFLSEFLQTVWIQYHQLNVLECMVGMVGSKSETTALKKDLASCFSQKDYKTAKQIFLDVYRKRPDILMEASDIDGELRLCMQIISTCEYEDDAYGHCILDTYHSYPELINHFKQLNYFVASTAEAAEDKIHKQHFLQNPYVTPLSLKIAKQLHDTQTKLY